MELFSNLVNVEKNKQFTTKMVLHKECRFKNLSIVIHTDDVKSHCLYFKKKSIEHIYKCT